VPEPWSRGDLRDFDGVVTYVRSIELPPAMRGRVCCLELGAIDDVDQIYWNFERIAGTDKEGSWRQPRRYRIAAELTAGWGASLGVRVLDTGGEGGFTGTPAELRLFVADDPTISVPLAGTWDRTVVAKLADLPPWPVDAGPNRPAVLWNGMLAPLLPFPFTGAIWYQGEANRGRADQYARLLPAMVRDWRRAFARELPFYFVQIAPFAYDGDAGETALLREAQAAVLALPDTGMVVTVDCGDAGDIHPTWKQPVGERLAALALSRHYGGGGVCEGPRLANATRSGADVRLAFAAADGGLQLANDGAGFELAGADGRFHRATARLDGDCLVLRADAVAEPALVRYAWAPVPDWSLRNAAGFPAPPFRASIR
jgi:sialate O-acetylesterase